MRLYIILALTLTLLSAENREALLIGNSNYKHITNLDDPSKNLNRLEKTLEDLNFNVQIKKDLDSINLENSIDAFASRLHGDTIGFLYYTGHGCQVDYQGYLVPINVNTQKKLQIKYKAFNINAMLEKFKGAGNKVNMIFLDACRDVPLGAKGGLKGLGQPNNTPNGSLVVYATQAGKVANDNSYFIDALISNIKQPSQTIRDIGDNISLNVAIKSSHHQIPVVYSSLLPKLSLINENYIKKISNNNRPKVNITQASSVNYRIRNNEEIQSLSKTRISTPIPVPVVPAPRIPVSVLVPPLTKSVGVSFLLYFLISFILLLILYPFLKRELLKV